MYANVRKKKKERKKTSGIWSNIISRKFRVSLFLNARKTKKKTITFTSALNEEKGSPTETRPFF